MHVLYVTSTFPPDNGWGGIGTYVRHMARGMTALGHRVTVLCGVGEKGAYEAVEDNLCILRQMRTDRFRGDELRRHIAALVSDAIGARGVDLVEFGEHGSEGLEFQRQRPDFPTVVRLHCCTRLAVYGDDPWYKRLARCCVANRAMLEADRREKESVRRAHGVTACSQWVLAANRAAGWVFPELTEVVYNPIARSDGPPRADDKDYEAPRVLVLGRVCRLKGASLFPGIVRRVARQVPEVRFEFIGQDCRKGAAGSWTQWIMGKLPASLHGNVHFAGGVPHPAVMGQVLPRHSLALFASVHEAFPYSHLECMQAGLACVIASGGGAQEAGVAGQSFLRAPRSAGGVADAIVRLLKDPVLRRRIGRSAREQVNQAFAAPRIAQQMQAVYARTIGLPQVSKTWTSAGSSPG